MKIYTVLLLAIYAATIILWVHFKFPSNFTESLILYFDNKINEKAIHIGGLAI